MFPAAHITLGLKVYAFTVEQKHFCGATYCGSGKMPLGLNFSVFQHTNLALMTHRNAGDILADLTIDLLSIVQRGKLNSVQTFWHCQREKDIIRMFCWLLNKVAADNPTFTSEKMTFCRYMTVMLYNTFTW